MPLDSSFRHAVKASSRTMPSLERKPGKQNWVDHAGGLPSYIERIAKHLHYEQGMSIGRAIATAVNQCRKWAAGGADVKPATRAKAAKAIAEWEAKKAKSKARTAARAAKGQPTSTDLMVEKPVAPWGKKRRKKKAEPTEKAEDEVCIVAQGEISKVDKARKQVFGWAYVAFDGEGDLNVDKSGEFIDDVEEVEKMAYGFVVNSREGDLDHTNETCSTMIESMVFTPEKIEKMGLPDDTPVGWWVGFQLENQKDFDTVVNGERAAFSIYGKAAKKDVE